MPFTFINLPNALFYTIDCYTTHAMSVGCSFTRDILLLTVEQAERPLRLHTISAVINLVYRWKLELPERPSSQYWFFHCIHYTEGGERRQGNKYDFNFLLFFKHKDILPVKKRHLWWELKEKKSTPTYTPRKAICSPNSTIMAAGLLDTLSWRPSYRAGSNFWIFEILKQSFALTPNEQAIGQVNWFQGGGSSLLV